MQAPGIQQILQTDLTTLFHRQGVHAPPPPHSTTIQNNIPPPSSGEQETIYRRIVRDIKFSAMAKFGVKMFTSYPRSRLPRASSLSSFLTQLSFGFNVRRLQSRGIAVLRALRALCLHRSNVCRWLTAGSTHAYNGPLKLDVILIYGTIHLRGLILIEQKPKQSCHLFNSSFESF